MVILVDHHGILVPDGHGYQAGGIHNPQDPIAGA